MHAHIKMYAFDVALIEAIMQRRCHFRLDLYVIMLLLLILLPSVGRWVLIRFLSISIALVMHEEWAFDFYVFDASLFDSDGCLFQEILQIPVLIA